MKLLIHTETGKTALIAFLIHFAIICGWCLDGPSSAAGQDVTARTIELQSNCSSSNQTKDLIEAPLFPSPSIALDQNNHSILAVRKRSADPDYNIRTAETATMMRVQGTDTYSVVQSAIPVASALTEPVKRLSLGLLLPHTTFKVREYSKAVQTAMISLRKQDLSFLHTYRFQVSDIHTDMLKVNPSPTGRFFFLYIKVLNFFITFFFPYCTHSIMKAA